MAHHLEGVGPLHPRGLDQLGIERGKARGKADHPESGQRPECRGDDRQVDEWNLGDAQGQRANVGQPLAEAQMQRPEVEPRTIEADHANRRREGPEVGVVDKRPEDPGCRQRDGHGQHEDRAEDRDQD